jgi:PAS domain S-box-containing protein
MATTEPRKTAAGSDALLREGVREGGTGLDDAMLHALVDAAPDGILMIDEDGTILFANHQAEQLFGWGADELRTRVVEDLLPERLGSAHRAHRTRYRADPRVRPMGAGLVLFGRRRDGSEFPVEISLSPLASVSGTRVVAVVRDVTERVEAEQRLHETEQHLRLVEDRERIARDLHDVVVQKLFACGMTVQSIAARATDPDHCRRLNMVVDDLDETIREIRSVIFSLRSDTRDTPGVRADVLRVVDDERDALGFEPRIRFDGPIDAMRDDVAAELLPTVREAVSNVARHAGATSVEIAVEHGDDFVTLRVLDDGCGVAATAPRGNGLRNISERAARLGGRCSVTARPEGGTSLEWRVPARNQPVDRAR